MKKIQILGLGAIAVFTVACNGGGDVSTKVPLKTTEDTLSYAYGVKVAEQGLTQYLQQMGVMQDTLQIYFEYNPKIQAEEDSLKKLAIRKEMSQKMDSVRKANNKNMADFYKGLQKGLMAKHDDGAYAKGQDIGRQLNQMSESFKEQVLKSDDVELNKKALLAGVVSVLKKEDPLFASPSVVLDEKVRQLQEAELKEQFSGNLEAGEKFLAENKNREGVVTLPSGLQYEVIEEGKGEKPSATDRVKVHYHGTLIDGTVFDSSVDRGTPATFGVNQVIKGWTEALQLMPAGSKWKLYIPQDLAYGAANQGTIQPFSTLVFDVELIEIENK